MMLVFQEKNPKLKTAPTKTNTVGPGKTRVKNLPISKGFFVIESFSGAFFLIFNFEAGFDTPQLGQVFASVETAFPHSLQLDIAIIQYPTTIFDQARVQKVVTLWSLLEQIIEILRLN